MIRETLCFVDVETTGLEPGYHEVIEVAVTVLTEGDLTGGNARVKTYAARMMPLYEIRAQAEALKVNGYSSERWHDGTVPLASRFEAMREVHRLTKGCKFVGHNAGFDHAFLNAEMKRMDLPPLDVHHHLLCTKSMAWPFYANGLVRDTHLDTLCDYFGISNAGKHTAEADVRRMMQLYECLTRDT